MNRNRRIFIVVFVFFTALVIFLVADMASRTTAPWNRKKQTVRVTRPDGTVVDSVGIDTLLLPK